jgi:hypothetical protein
MLRRADSRLKNSTGTILEGGNIDGKRGTLQMIDPKLLAKATGRGGNRPKDTMLPIETWGLDSCMLTRLRTAIGLGLSVAFVACGTSDKPAMSSAGTTVVDTDGSTVSCTDDPRISVYTANLKKPGQNGVLSFTLVESEPAPPARGINVLKLKVEMDGTPVTGDLLAALKMPDHGHPTTVQPIVTFDPSTATYTINPAFLYMPGVWLLQFDAYEAASDAGRPLDTVAYYFCIEG